MDKSGFFDAAEIRMCDAFTKDGYWLQDVEEKRGLDRIQGFVREYIGKTIGKQDIALVDLHNAVSVDKLNDFRLGLFRALNGEDWFRPCFYRLARHAVSTLVGNEVSMQKRINLSIQMPGDTSSILPVHADTWSGDSAYEIVVWLPLVDVRDSMTMFLARPAAAEALASRFTDFKSAEDLYQALKPNIQSMEMKAGQVLLFNQQLPHGNRLNETSMTRWSLNCRFKSVWSPVADKRTGEFFEPITLRPMTRLGAAYKMPTGGTS